MNQDFSPENRSRAISVNLHALRAQLTYALQQTTEACAFAQSGEQNCAIGSIVCLREVLSDADALYRAAIALHCINLRPPVLRTADATDSGSAEADTGGTRGARLRFLDRFLRRK